MRQTQTINFFWWVDTLRLGQVGVIKLIAGPRESFLIPALLD